MTPIPTSPSTRYLLKAELGGDGNLLAYSSFSAVGLVSSQRDWPLLQAHSSHPSEYPANPPCHSPRCTSQVPSRSHSAVSCPLTPSCPWPTACSRGQASPLPPLFPLLSPWSASTTQAPWPGTWHPLSSGLAGSPGEHARHCRCLCSQHCAQPTLCLTLQCHRREHKGAPRYLQGHPHFPCPKPLPSVHSAPKPFLKVTSSRLFMAIS